MFIFNVKANFLTFYFVAKNTQKNYKFLKWRMESLVGISENVTNNSITFTNIV